MKAEAAPQQRVGIFQPAGRGILGMKNKMVGQRAAQHAAIKPVAPPSRPAAACRPAQARPQHFRQQRQDLAAPHVSFSSAAILAAYFDGPP